MRPAWLFAVAVFSCSAPPPAPNVNTLKVTQGPVDTQAGELLKPPLVVQLRAADGTVATQATNHITVALGLHPPDAQLSGTKELDATAGVAVFSDLSIDKAGHPFTLFVSSPGFDEDSSPQFALSSPPSRHLDFAIEPTSTRFGMPIVPVIEVVVLDDNQHQVLSEEGTLVTLEVLNAPDGGFVVGNQGTTLGGAVTFPSLFLDQPGAGLQLRAIAPAAGYASVDSLVFNDLP